MPELAEPLLLRVSEDEALLRVKPVAGTALLLGLGMILLARWLQLRRHFHLPALGPLEFHLWPACLAGPQCRITIATGLVDRNTEPGSIRRASRYR